MNPLPLTPLESYLYHDDTRAHPCWQFCRISYRGSLRRDAMEKAWAEATGRQRLLNCVVRRGALGSLRWVPGPGGPPPLHWSRGEAGAEWPKWQPLDLERGPGARLYVIEREGSGDCIICVHHAVCDGLALLEVMEDTFVIYARELGEGTEPRPAPPGRALAARGRYGRNLAEAVWIPALQVAGMAAEWRLFTRQVAPILPSPLGDDDAGAPPGWPFIVSRRWSIEEANAVKAAARDAKVSVAELCMRDLQAAVGAWRKAHGVDEPEAWLRLGMAVSLRRRTRDPWPAANIFGISVIDRQAKTLDRRERLLRRAHEDMTLIEKWHLGYAFWVLLAACRWLPGGLRGYARRRVVRMTLVMSYMGKVFAKMPLPKEGQHPVVPGAVITEIVGVAPTRRGTALCVDFGLIFGRLDMHVHFDPLVLDRARAQALVEEFGRQLSMSLAGK
ncbi:MAG TPA: hypothetical protein VGG34_00180 [Opitutaceae bacterium]|jgi:hypothetical protein